MPASELLAAITVDTEYPTSWAGRLEQAARTGVELAERSRGLGVPLTWMIKISAQEKLANAEHFFATIAPRLPREHELGLHVHFDDEAREHYLREPEARAALIAEGAALLRGFGVRPRCFRAGCLRAESSDIPVLEAEGIAVGSSVAPGISGNRDIADWRQASIHTPYHPAPTDLARRGAARLVEVPLLTDGQRPLVLDVWQTTPESRRILEVGLSRGDRFLCLLGHDGTTDLARFEEVVARLRTAGARLVTLGELAEAWSRSAAAGSDR